MSRGQAQYRQYGTCRTSRMGADYGHPRFGTGLNRAQNDDLARRGLPAPSAEGMVNRGSLKDALTTEKAAS